MKAILEVTNGPYAGRKTSLRAPVQLSVGRTGRADYAIPHDLQMSSVHFTLQVEIKGATLRDLGSTNGTYVNEVRTEQVELRDGDLIRAGETRFRVVFDEPPPRPNARSGDTKVDLHPEDVLLPATSTGATEDASIHELQRSDKSVAEPAEDELETERAAPMSVNEAPFEYRSIVASDGAQSVRQPIAISANRPYESAFADESPQVVDAALEAAAWTAQPWLLDYCRERAKQPTLVDLPFLKMLAVLGLPDDLQRIYFLTQQASLGHARMTLVGQYGHPSLLRLLIDNFENRDARTAVEAGLAFQRIVGGDFESGQRVTLPPTDGSEVDDFEAEFLDQGQLADKKKAEQYLSKHRSQLKKVTRMSHGVDLSQPITSDFFRLLSMEARWEAALRGVYRSELRLNPQQLTRFRPLFAK